MIKYIAGILLLCSLSEATAQNDSLMPNLSANYLVHCNVNGGTGSANEYIFSNPNPAFDTVDVYNDNEQLLARLYMDTLKVWIKRIAPIQDCYVGWSEQEFTNEWELLYDFGLEVGDSTYAVYSSSGLITSIEEIEVQGQIRKKFIIGDGDSAYIQGIGDIHHPFQPKMYMFENYYETCTSHLYYSGPSPIDSITFSPDCNGEILSVSQIELANFNVYPNPAVETLHISLKDAGAISGSIYDALGKSVKSFSIKSQETRIDIHELTPGIYFVKIQLESGQIVVRKFVKGR